MTWRKDYTKITISFKSTETGEGEGPGIPIAVLVCLRNSTLVRYLVGSMPLLFDVISWKTNNRCLRGAFEQKP